MGKNRLDAFSDDVIAIIITIMVLELKVPVDDVPHYDQYPEATGL
jgi:TMEM175 potassium channel family protein